MIKVTSKKFPSVIYEMEEINKYVLINEKGIMFSRKVLHVRLTPIELVKEYHKEGTQISDLPVREITYKSFVRNYTTLDTLEAGSMRHNREGRKIKLKPFIPNPYFLRQSMISSYLQCPDKFYDTYENGYNESTIYTAMGTAIHGVMEDFYKDPQGANVDDLFKLWWAEHGPEEPELYSEWKDLLVGYFDHLKNYPEPNILALELEFKTEIAGIPVSGTIDRIDRLDEDTVLIVDYKSNQMPYTPAQLRESTQFKFYVLALMTDELHAVLGEYKNIVCAYDMLRTGKRQFISYTREELETFKEWLVIIWSTMLSGKGRKPKLNQYCSFCQKRHKCDMYQEMLKSPTSIVATEDINMDTLAEDLDTLKQSKKLIENRIAEVEGIIKNGIIEHGGPVIYNNVEWSMKSQKSTLYPMLKIFDIVNGDEQAINDLKATLSPMSATAINKIKSLKAYKEKLAEIAEESYKSPSLVRKKIEEETVNETNEKSEL